MAQIAAVSIPGSSIPVIEFVSGIRKCHYQKNTCQLFSADGVGAGHATPLALLQGTANLVVDVTIPGDASTLLYEVNAFLSNENNTGGVAFTESTHVTAFSNDPDLLLKTSTGEMPILAPKVGGIEKPVPWAYNGTLVVQLISSASAGTLKTIEEEVHMPVEIYVLSAELPDLYLGPGVPLALLRLETLIPVWLQSQEVDWPTFVTRALFNDERLQYHVINGFSKYTTWETEGMGLNDAYQQNQGNIIIDCWLDLWLSDMNGLTARGDKTSQYSVDCYDIAAISQAIMFIGTDPAKLRLKYMQPFGYINAVKLIGVKEANPTYQLNNPNNLCNNPMFASMKYDPRVMCPPDTWNRSPFGNHMFLTYLKDPTNDPIVLDAEPPPADRNLQQYCADSIDTSGEWGQEAGKAENAYDGPGLSTLATTALFAGQAMKRSGLLEALSLQLDGKGTLQEPYVGDRTWHRGITMTWTFTVRPQFWQIFTQDDLIMINIYSYSAGGITDLYVNEQWTLRKAAIAGFQADPTSIDADDNPMRGFSDDPTGCTYMFRIPEKGWLAVLTSEHCKSVTLAPVAALVQTTLNSLPPQPPLPQLTVTQTILGSDSDIEVGTEFKITVLATGGDGGQYWRGYKVDTKFGGVLLLDVEVDDDQNVEFTFIARKPGTETVGITLFDANADLVFKQQTVEVLNSNALESKNDQ
ncbi:MAG: hypothetical protein MMC33_008433 [Icmadophila ericetorum]|nr:hypothetical protein [Icmadophila ericetorum]